MKPDGSMTIRPPSMLSTRARMLASLSLSADSARLRSAVSWKVSTAPVVRPSSTMGALVYATVRKPPSLRTK